VKGGADYFTRPATVALININLDYFNLFRLLKSPFVPGLG
jgi:hypothetical protein